MKKKLIVISVLAMMLIFAFAGCTGGDAEEPATEGSEGGKINVISREDGSGTRGAFIELMGIEKKEADGTKVDQTTLDAVIANKTDVMLTKVAADELSIGYVSLGSLNDTVKAVKIDGIEATQENIINGTYKVARPFNIATKGAPSGITEDFINFIMSNQGQKVIFENKFIAIDESAPEYTGKDKEGKIVIAGSSSVSPVMEKLKEAYNEINPKVEIEIQTSDSTAGMTSLMDGNCDIGMASRDLKDSEKAALTDKAIAMDGIAVIVNQKNKVEDISSESIQKIYIGEITDWKDI